MYASDKTDTVTIDAASGPVVVSIQALNWKMRKRAAAIALEQSSATIARLTSGTGREALIAALADRAARLKATESEQTNAPPAAEEPAEAPEPVRLTDAEVKAAQAARYRLFDQETVLRGGITSSSDKAKKTVEALINDLEEDAADTLHRRILDLTLPPITADAPETVRKNG